MIEEARDGREVLYRKPYSNHPKDNFLEVVLVWWHGKFVTWTRNLQTGGFDAGNYFELRMYSDDLEKAFVDALEDYDSRGKVRTEVAKIYKHNAGYDG